MQIPANKKVVCITGSVWTGSRSAPRRMLVKDGFRRPIWFTTGRPMTDAQYRQISATQFHIARAKKNVVAHIEYRGSFIGVMRDDFETAMAGAKQGVLVVGPPEIAAQLAAALPQAKVFSLKDAGMDLSEHLDAAQRAGQLHRIDVDVLAPGAWTEVHRTMADVIGIPLTERSPRPGRIDALLAPERPVAAACFIGCRRKPAGRLPDPDSEASRPAP